MVLFAAFISAAVWRRRDRDSHKRLMLLAYVSIIGPAVARIPGPPLLGLAVVVLFVAMGMAYDRYSRRRIHAVYLWGGALLAISGPATQALSGTTAWRAFAEAIIR
jgi:cell division protein FtsW (lipid II flippase)